MRRPACSSLRLTLRLLLPLLAGCSFDPSAPASDREGGGSGVVGGAGDPSPDGGPDLADLDGGVAAPDADAGKPVKPGPDGDGPGPGPGVAPTGS
jgi:hypothetical protein